MYDLRLDRKLTKSMFAKWDKETKDWVVNAIASLVVVDQVVESHEMVALQEAIELLDSRNEIENLMKMIKQKKMFKIDILNTSMSQAGEIYFYPTPSFTTSNRRSGMWVGMVSPYIRFASSENHSKNDEA